MPTLKSVRDWVKKSIGVVEDFLAPEDHRVHELLKLEPWTMRNLLPKSHVHLSDISVLFDYQNQIVRLIVKAIKYKNNQSLRRRIALYLYEELMDLAPDIALFEGAPPLLIPMPMSKHEKQERGFNQTEELAREIQNFGGKEVAVAYDLLKKTRETARQTGLSRDERAQNLANSMEVQKSDIEKIRGRVVVVLDDVYTTGASLSEARRALLAASAKRVIGLFIAH